MAKKKVDTNKDIVLKGIFKDNPTFVMLLGMCPTLAVTNSFSGALGMGLSVLFVLILTNMIISAIKGVVPTEVRIPVYITLIATVVTILEYVLQLVSPGLYEELGVYIALIVVNCIILGRAEAFASENTVKKSFFDAVGVGTGFLLGLSILGFFRELLGTGSISMLNIQLINSHQAPAIFAESAGAFLSLGLIVGLIQSKRISKEREEAELKAYKIEMLKAEKAKRDALKAEGGSN